MACEAVFKSAKNSEGVDIELEIGGVLGATITGQIGEGAYATVYGACQFERSTLLTTLIRCVGSLR